MFYIIRYFPDLIRDEFVNVGIILVSVGEENRHTPLIRLTRDWSRVRCMDPDADIEMLASVEESLRVQFQKAGERSLELIEKLDESFSLSLRLERTSAPSSVGLGAGKGVLADDFESQLDHLMKLYVEARVSE